MRCNINHHMGRAVSTTRTSHKNCFRYLRIAEGVGASGVPRFISSTPNGRLSLAKGGSLL